MNLEQSRTLQQFGITLKESERYNTVSSLFGRTLAEHELQHNLKSYEREFLMDEAVSLPHAYHHINREFYSQETEHPLFNVKKQIDKRERDGVTLDGFERFEQMVMQAPNDMVSLWYSPDGPSGFPGSISTRPALCQFQDGRKRIGEFRHQSPPIISYPSPIGNDFRAKRTGPARIRLP
jgi:hypothetical protein